MKITENIQQPRGELALKTIAMPENTNANGDIFGGWIVSQMDIAACILAKNFCRTRVATVAIDSMSFHQPVSIGDVVSCYCELLKVGNTSMQIKVETWITNHLSDKAKHVTEGIFVIVAIDDDGKPTPVIR